MKYSGYHILCLNPTIGVCKGEYQPLASGYAPPLPKTIRLDAILEFLTWYCGGMNLRHVAARYAAQKHDGIRRLILTLNDDEESDRTALGLEGFKMADWIFIPDNVFRIISCEVKYDAIYTARLAPFKRIHLAKYIPKLKLLTGGSGEFNEEVPRIEGADYELEFQFANQVATWINQCHCGLALSEEEGIMLANTEYLLCGRPVISTPSCGGRDQMYTQNNSLIVDPDPSTIARAVEQVKEMDFDRLAIREHALKRLQSDRYRFACKVSDLRVEMGGSMIPPEIFYADMYIDPDGFEKRYITTLTDREPDPIESIEYCDPINFCLNRGFVGACTSQSNVEKLVTGLGECARRVLELVAVDYSVEAIISTCSGREGTSKFDPVEIRMAIQALIEQGIIRVNPPKTLEYNVGN